jgi:hypothetical protein
MLFFKKRSKPQAAITEEELNWVKDTMARLLIENSVLRLVTGHLIAAKCKETNNPTDALRDLHRALDEAAQIVLETEKSAGEQRIVEMYQPKIDELITVASKLLSPGPRQP